MVFLRQRCVLRNFEPNLRKWKLHVLHDGAFEGFMVAISVRVPVAQWKRRSTVSDYP